MSTSCYLYVVARELNDGALRGPVKIGISRAPNGRLSSLQTGSPYRLIIANLFRLPSRESAQFIEQYVLAAFPEKRMAGEWLDMEPDCAIGWCGMAVAGQLARWGTVKEEDYHQAGIKANGNGVFCLAPNRGAL